MMRIHLVALVGSFVMSSFCFVHVAAAQEPDPTTKEVILVSLHKLEKMFGQRGFGFQDEQNLKEKLSRLRGLGFESVDQLENVIIGQGFPLYVVRLDLLKKYDEGTDPWSLLSKSVASIYPLIVYEEKKDLGVHSSATVSFQQEEKEKPEIPHVAEIGNPELIRLLTEARTEWQKEGRCLLPSECFAVSIPALSLHLFGSRDEGTKVSKMVTLNHVRGHVKKKDFRTGKDVFKELASEAKNQPYDRSVHRPNKNKLLAPAK